MGNSQMVKDLSLNMAERLHVVCNDYMDLCKTAGIPAAEAMAAMQYHLMRSAAYMLKSVSTITSTEAATLFASIMESINVER